MKTKSQLWVALFVRWGIVSLLCLLASWLYNNDDPFWHMHVDWISRGAMVMFWIVQVLHVVFLGMLGLLILDNKYHKKST